MKQALEMALKPTCDRSVDRILATSFFRTSPLSQGATVITLADKRSLLQPSGG